MPPLGWVWVNVEGGVWGVIYVYTVDSLRIWSIHYSYTHCHCDSQIKISLYMQGTLKLRESQYLFLYGQFIIHTHTITVILLFHYVCLCEI